MKGPSFRLLDDFLYGLLARASMSFRVAVRVLPRPPKGSKK